MFRIPPSTNSTCMSNAARFSSRCERPGQAAFTCSASSTSLHRAGSVGGNPNNTNEVPSLHRSTVQSSGCPVALKWLCLSARDRCIGTGCCRELLDAGIQSECSAHIGQIHLGGQNVRRCNLRSPCPTPKISSFCHLDTPVRQRPLPEARSAVCMISVSCVCGMTEMSI